MVFTPNEELARTARLYAELREIAIYVESPLGFGSDGTIWPTSRGSALKILNREQNYLVERDCYVRLQQVQVRHVGKLNVPMLVDFDDRLLAIEMTIVKPPYLLDFGKVYIDEPPAYWHDEQLMANYYEEKARLFGKNWPRVLSALASLEQLGIYYVDPRPQNIAFGGGDDSDV